MHVRQSKKRIRVILKRSKKKKDPSPFGKVTIELHVLCLIPAPARYLTKLCLKQRQRWFYFGVLSVHLFVHLFGRGCELKVGRIGRLKYIIISSGNLLGCPENEASLFHSHFLFRRQEKTVSKKKDRKKHGQFLIGRIVFDLIVIPRLATVHFLTRVVLYPIKCWAVFFLFASCSGI